MTGGVPALTYILPPPCLFSYILKNDIIIYRFPVPQHSSWLMKNLSPSIWIGGVMLSAMSGGVSDSSIAEIADICTLFIMVLAIKPGTLSSNPAHVLIDISGSS